MPPRQAFREAAKAFNTHSRCAASAGDCATGARSERHAPQRHGRDRSAAHASAANRIDGASGRIERPRLPRSLCDTSVHRRLTHHRRPPLQIATILAYPDIKLPMYKPLEDTLAELLRPEPRSHSAEHHLAAW